MFLQSKYILANELVQKMDIHIANISMLRKHFEDLGDEVTMIKKGNCTFINTKSVELPNNIQVGILTNEFTDMTDKLPCTWVKNEYEMTERELFKSGLVIDKQKIAGKDFYVFAPEYAKKLKWKIPYILNKEETDMCFAKGQIDGFVQLGKNKFFTWY